MNSEKGSVALPTPPLDAHVPAQSMYPGPPVHHPARHQHVHENGAEREWSTGLCGCSLGGCCMSFWLPCVVHGQNKQRLELLREGQLVDESKVDCCSGNAFLYCLVNYFTGCACILDVMLRGDLRKRYHIKGGGCTDCLTVCFCGLCSQQQMARELKLEEENTRQVITSQQIYGTKQMHV